MGCWPFNGAYEYRRHAKSQCNPSSREISSLEKVSPGIKPRFFSQKIEQKLCTRTHVSSRTLDAKRDSCTWSGTDHLVQVASRTCQRRKYPRRRQKPRAAPRRILNCNSKRWFRTRSTWKVGQTTSKQSSKHLHHLPIHFSAHCAFFLTAGIVSIAWNSLCFSFGSLMYVSSNWLYISEAPQVHPQHSALENSGSIILTHPLAHLSVCSRWPSESHRMHVPACQTRHL